MAANGQYDGPLESLVRDVHTKLEQHSHRMEQAIMNQQWRLEACMRALGIDQTGAPIPLNVYDPVLESDMDTQVVQNPGGTNAPVVIVGEGKSGSDAAATPTVNRGSTMLLNQTAHDDHHDSHQDAAQTTRRSSSTSEINGPRKSCCQPIVEHSHFNHVVGVIILLSGLLICIDADYIAREPGSTTHPVIMVFETVFFVIFLVELLMRMETYRWIFFTGEDWRWNVFDSVVVLTAAIEETVKLIQLLGARPDDSAEGLTIFKLMRIMKLTRAIRLVRVFKAFRELRIMVISIISTLRTLFWSVVCTLMIMAGFAVYLVTIVSDHQASAGPSAWAVQYFGSMPAGMLSLFAASTGGVDWQNISDALWDVSPTACIAFLGYVSMMAYAIMNILTGICVNNANRAAEDDFDLSFHEERSKHKNVITSLKNIFHGADTRGEGTLTWTDLDKHLHDQQVRALFKKIDLETWHLKSFFEMMGADEGDEEPSIGIDAFIRGCLRLRCTVKNIDLMASRHDESEHFGKRLHEIRDQVALLHNAVMRSNAMLHNNGQRDLSGPSNWSSWGNLACRQ